MYLYLDRLINFFLSFRYLVSDAAYSIRNAFKAVFGAHTTLIMCWFHMKKNAVKWIDLLLKEKKQREEAKTDINLLHISPNKDMFEKGVTLFRKKWAKESEFLAYVDKMWLTSHDKWYGGAAEPGIPLTNNSLESFNSKVKKQGTFRKRMKMGAFLNRMVVIMNIWSKESDVLAKLFIQSKTWTKRYQVSITKARIYRKNSSSCYGAIFPGRGKNVSRDDINKYREKNCSSFFGFKDLLTRMWDVKLPKNDWEKGTCTCPFFIVKYMCHHIIDLALRLKLVSPPPDVCSISIGVNRGPGRPKKATKALIID